MKLDPVDTLWIVLFGTIGVGGTLIATMLAIAICIF